MSAPFVVPLDQARLKEARSAGIILLIVEIGLLVLGLVGLLLAWVWDLRPYTFLLCGVLVLLGLVTTLMGVKRLRQQRLVTASSSQIAFGADDEGLTLAGLPTIPWDEVLAVSTVDDRARMARRRGLITLTDGLSQRSGAGLLGIAVIIRHGKEYREALPDSGQKGRITVYNTPHSSDGLHRGWTTLLVDAVLPMLIADGCLRVAIQAARSRGIDTGEFTSQMDFIAFNGKYVDERWT